MRRSAAEWAIRPSQRQRLLDLAAAGIVVLIVGLLAAEFLLLAVPVFLLSVFSLRKHRVTQIGVNEEGWWIGCGRSRRSVSWHSGSQRLPDHLFLVWGFWPWQTLHLNADSLADDDAFRRLKMALYGSL